MLIIVSFFLLIRRKIGRYGFLLLSMFLMIGLKPFLEDLVRVDLLADIFFSGVLISGVYALSNNPTAFKISCLLVLVIIGLKIVHQALGNVPGLYLLEITLSTLFFTQMLIIIFEHLLVEQNITGDMIMGSACAFVLLGLIWAYIYYLLEIAQPNSFKAAEQLGDDLGNFVYYSFVTLTTLGYGDVLAVSKQARGLTILEAVVGQLYLAIMISRLVSLHTSELQHK
jgi:hypothetical protein